MANTETTTEKYPPIEVRDTPLEYRQFDRVEITGSSIIAKEAKEALPVQVISRQEIERSGATNLPQLLQKLPGMFNFFELGALTGTTFGGPETAAIHGNQNGTLVLLNGRRLPFYGSQTIFGERATVDLNLVPLANPEFQNTGQCPNNWYTSTNGASTACWRNGQRLLTLYPATEKKLLFVDGEILLNANWTGFGQVIASQVEQRSVTSPHSCLLRPASKVHVKIGLYTKNCNQPSLKTSKSLSLFDMTNTPILEGCKLANWAGNGSLLQPSWYAAQSVQDSGRQR